MPKYTVKRLVDAAVIYTAEVEAESEAQAVELAWDREQDYQWSAEGSVVEYDARRFEVRAESGEVLADCGDW
jgi:hypothetical protein